MPTAAHSVKWQIKKVSGGAPLIILTHFYNILKARAVGSLSVTSDCLNCSSSYIIMPGTSLFVLTNIENSKKFKQNRVGSINAISFLSTVEGN